MLKADIRAMDYSNVKGLASEQIAQLSLSEKLSLDDGRALINAKKIGIVLAAKFLWFWLRCFVYRFIVPGMCSVGPFSLSGLC